MAVKKGNTSAKKAGSASAKRGMKKKMDLLDVVNAAEYAEKKSAARKTRNGDSYKGIPIDKRKSVALTVRVVRAAGKRTTPGEIYLSMLQREAANAECEKKQAEQQVGETLGEVRAAFAPALFKLIEAGDLAAHIEDEEQNYIEEHTLARCVRLLIKEAGKEFEQALCDLGLIPEDDCSSFVGTLKSRIPVEAQPKFMEMYTRWSKVAEKQAAA